MPSEPLPDDYHEPDYPHGLYRRKDCWRFRRTVKGQKVNVSLGAISRQAAFEEANRLNAQLAAGVNVEHKVKRQNTSIRNFVDAFLESKQRQVRGKTRARYHAVFENFLYWLGQHYPSITLDAVTYEVAERYITERAKGPVIPNGKRQYTRSMFGESSPWTVRKEREYLCSLFKEALRRELVTRNPFAEIRTRKPTREEIAAAHNVLTPVESQKLIAAAYDLDKGRRNDGCSSFGDAIFFMLKTGLRDDELRHLEWTDIDWVIGRVAIRPKQVTETRSGSIPAVAIPKLERLLRRQGSFRPRVRQSVRLSRDFAVHPRKGGFVADDVFMC